MVDNHWLVILYGAAISRNITLKTAKQTCSNNVCFHLESVFWLPRLAILLVYHLRCHLNHFSLARDIHHMKNASPNFQHLNQPYLATNSIFSRRRISMFDWANLFLPCRPWHSKTQWNCGVSVEEMQNTSLVVDLSMVIMNQESGLRNKESWSRGPETGDVRSSD